jgi:hypothetical protein
MKVVPSIATLDWTLDLLILGLTTAPLGYCRILLLNVLDRISNVKIDCTCLNLHLSFQTSAVNIDCTICKIKLSVSTTVPVLQTNGSLEPFQIKTPLTPKT